MSESTFMGVSREKIDWSPRIDFTKCNYCMECVEFCPHKVFEVNEEAEQKFSVKNPNNCVVFCRACGKTCGLDAIEFPNKTETTKRIKEIRQEAVSDE
ncbi:MULTISPECIES: ferredoxin family protein [unclassified Dehalobacter]|jgi:Ferredoxin|uniref:4Fe-4S dicluster domain-containing protein n=1 Tax=unclassified Dehalobacter TaxID=2635733 RepID=UPI00028A47CF|nr:MULTISPECIES: ferredoxin family protein [unclassified Dehalobacter]AFV01182.1 Ferredoxin [Dehalobacter sp. DCA]AFV04224.1 Ferredoxin [Dehalobacter sp. CF]